VYRGLWRYIGVADLIVYARAVGIGSVLAVAAFVLLFRFHGLSRAVFALDALLLLLMMAGSRLAFRLFRQMLPRAQPAGRRVLIYGAGDAGELLLRELRNNAALGCLPVGFADDDPHKAGKVIHGLRVYGGNGKLREICGEHAIDEVYISTARFGEERIGEILRDCREAGVGLKLMRITFDPVCEKPVGLPGPARLNGTHRSPEAGRAASS
jgi:UDP-GlcNAc:undecaprenyl-phosphate GlcNAc-1-phosphate transferase